MPSPFRLDFARTTLALTPMAAATLALALGMAVVRPAHAASPVEGYWRTAEGDGLVQIRPCGAQICGYLVDHDKLRVDPAAKDMMNTDMTQRGRPMMDMLLLASFSGGPSKFEGGKIYNPENGKTYVGILELLDTARLKVTGCLVRPLCGSQVWKRAR